VTNLLGPEFLGFGRKAEVGIDLPLREQLDRFAASMGDEGDVFLGIQPDIGGYARDEDVAAGIQHRDRHRFPFQVADRADAVGPEELIAADMAACQHGDRIPGVDAADELRGEVHVDVRLPGGQRLLDAFRPLRLKVVHLREPLTSEEFLSHVLHALTNTGGLDQPDFCGLGRWLRHHPFGRQAEQAGSPRQRQSP
jgi:hypothetical protein